MREKLDELARLHAAATGGDWKYTPIANWVSAENGRVVCDAAFHRNQHIADADGAWIAASKNAFPDLLAYVRGLEVEREELRQYQEDETQRRAKSDCYDRICESLGVQSNVLGAIAARDAQQRREGAAEELKRLAGADMELRSMFLTDSDMGLRAFSHAKLADGLRGRAAKLLEGR